MGLKRIGKWLAGIVVVAFVAGAVAYFQFPLELSEVQTRWELHRADVQSVDLGPLHAEIQDHCAGSGGVSCSCLFLLHGLGDTSATWKRILLSSNTAWRKPVKLVALDLPGAGHSAPPDQPERYRVRRQAESVLTAAARVDGCTERVLVGNSLGGWIATWAALDKPEQVDRLVIVDGAGLRGQHDPLQPKEEAASLLTEPSIDSLKSFQARAYDHPRPLPERVWRAAVRRAASSHAREILAAQLPADDLDPLIGELRRPTLVFWGQSDRILSPAVGEELSRRIPGALLRTAPRCGHLPQKECPDILIRELSAFLFDGVK